MTIRSNAIAAFTLAIATFTLAAAPVEAPRSIERYALYVASNDGGPERERLRYARTDARRLAATMAEIGGIEAANSVLLLDPSKAEIDRAFSEISAKIRKNSGSAKRSEFLFYYSGHSSENALLLGTQSYQYGDLKRSLNDVPSDVHVVMLDSCYSGNFVRAKGGSRQKSFLMDDSTVVQGHAYLSSSSAREESQESDEIQASYFTQACIVGLRGAADTSGDGKVSLNELYHYAFNETLSNTESSAVGPQHPSYDITLVGSGDLVLTDLSSAESVLLIPSSFSGNFFIRNPDGLLVSEINKIAGTEVALALPAGSYTIAIVTATTTSQSAIELSKGQRMTLDGGNFSVIQRTAGRSRGGASEDDREEPDTAEETWAPFSISLMPGISYPAKTAENVRFSLGLFMADDINVQSVQASSFLGEASGNVYGTQVAGFMTKVGGHLSGVQAAGFFAGADGPVNGIQASGFIAKASGDFSGIQASGFLCVSTGSFQGAQLAGFLNTAKSDFVGIQASGFMNSVDGPFTGFQAASFLNVSHADFQGLQAASFLNVSQKNFRGLQASGFLNVANKVSGVQLGIVNVAWENDGYAVGLLNFIVKGIMSPTVAVDSNGNLSFQYQGGTDALFTTFSLAGELGSDWGDDYSVWGFGLGTRRKASERLSFDFEILYLNIVDVAGLRAIKDTYGEEAVANVDYDDGEDTPAEIALKDWGKDNQKCGMPTVRATANWHFFKHLGVFASFALETEISGFNERAFELGSHGSGLDVGSAVSFHPVWSAGIRF